MSGYNEPSKLFPGLKLGVSVAPVFDLEKNKVQRFKSELLASKSHIAIWETF